MARIDLFAPPNECHRLNVRHLNIQDRAEYSRIALEEFHTKKKTLRD